MERDELARAYQGAHGELLAYLSRLVVRPEIAEELAQEAALRLLRHGGAVTEFAAVRPWLFRVGTNLAIDHLRSHATWREDALSGMRDRAEHSASFVEASRLLVGSPEMRTIAREHLTVCLMCTMRNLPHERAALLLLVEVHDFSLTAAAEYVGMTTVQAKNALQLGRARLRDLYGSTCALVTKRGACHQCVELSGYFNGTPDDPLLTTDRSVAARLQLMRQQRLEGATLGRWHRRMLRLLDDLLDGEA